MFQINKMPATIDIGIIGETNFRTHQFDMSAWMKDTPDGVPSIVVIRPTETAEDAYIAATEFDRETNVLSWTITAGDLGEVAGEGVMRIWLEEEDNEETIVKRGKSVEVTTIINEDKTRDPSDEPPEAQEAWMEQMTALKVATVDAAADADDAKDDAEAAEAAAEGSAEDAEAYAIGKRGGEDVTSGDPAYHNNSKYYAIKAWEHAGDAENAKIDAVAAKNAAVGAKNDAVQAKNDAVSAKGTAEAKALVAEGFAVGQQNGVDVASGSPYYQNNAKYYSGNADSQATAAGNSATTAGNKALIAEGYAVGKQNGEDVTSGSPYYQNNAKYYSDQASSTLSSKADKVSSAVSGNFAGLDSNGNLTDSGSKASDFLTEHQDISGKADKDTDAVEGNLAEFDSNGNPVDSGKAPTDYVAADDFYATEMPMSSSDSTKVSEAVSGLKSALKDETSIFVDASFLQNDVSLTAAYSGTALNPSGYVRSLSGYNVSQFINVENIAGIIANYDLDFAVDASSYAGIVFFTSNSFGNVVKYVPTVDGGFIYAIPENAKFVALTYPDDSTATVKLLSVNPLNERVETLETTVSDISEKVVDDRQLYDNDNPSIYNGYCNGVNFFSSNGHRIIYIPCKPNTYYTISADSALWVSNGVYTSPNAPANGGSASLFSTTSDAINIVENGRRYITNVTGSNANYLSVMFWNGNQTQIGTMEQVRATIMIAEGTERTAFVPYTESLKIKESALPDTDGRTVYNRAIIGKADTLTTGQKIEFNSPNIKKNNLITFSANINTFGSLTIGQGRDALNQTAYIVIDATTVKVWRYGASAPVEWISLNHGLTIADYIDVSIIVSNDEIGWAKLVITSNGETYTYNRMAWLGCGNVAYAEATSGSYSNCVLKHSTTDYEKELWLFGDSYFDHWVTHALADGYKNFLCDGWSGRKSAQALVSLDILMDHGKPSVIVWCMGMNDGDSSSAVNANWQNAYNTLTALCESENIKLVLCTIPNTPTVNNNYKNAIIRNSGYEYIDMAKAVGSDINTSWYTGLLSTDNVHPSTLGDEIIAKFMETALPQIYGY